MPCRKIFFEALKAYLSYTNNFYIQIQIDTSIISTLMISISTIFCLEYLGLPNLMIERQVGLIWQGL
jgi:hypothetical protein